MKKKCLQCTTEFEITDADLAFYHKVSPTFGGEKLSIPAPNLCYDCRQQKKLAWRNERTLHHRKCDLSGKPIISVYAPNTPYTVCDYKLWFSDSWEALEYGREFDFARPFFDQFHELHQAVPLPSMFIDFASENCDYTNLAKENRNCYLVFAVSQCEDCYYTTYMQRSKNVVDCFFVFDSELCYECLDCYHCYQVHYSEYCQNCVDSYFMYNCIGCSNCFGCVSLVKKEYHIFNKPYSKTEYEQKLQSLLSNPDYARQSRQTCKALLQSHPQKHLAGLSNEDVSGDHVSFSKNSQHCFDCTYLEDCKFCTWLHRCKDCYDTYAWGLSGELGYENHLVGENFFHVCFSDCCFSDVSELFYCRYCVKNCSNLFGCVGLQQKQYCILNKQYSKEEYNALVPKIIAHMQETGEWGQFFPEKYSPFGYNETVGQESYPLSEQMVADLGWSWCDDIPHTTGKQTIEWKSIPWQISEISESITKQVLCCTACSKNFRILSEELKFYQLENLPLPKECFDCRYQARRERRNPRNLWDRSCSKCSKAFQTTFSPESGVVPFCETCYQQAMY